MSTTVEAKQAVVAEVAEVAKTAQSAVAAEYRGLTVGEMTQLRATARASGVYVRVVKNTLARRAIEGTSFECMKGSLKGPLVLAFSREDPGAAARVFKGFAKDHEKLKTVALSVGGELYPAVRHRSSRVVADPGRGACKLAEVDERAAHAARAHARRACRDVGPDAQGSRRSAAGRVIFELTGNTVRSNQSWHCRTQN